MPRLEQLQRVADEIRILFREDRILTLGDMEYLTARYKISAAQVQGVLERMTTSGSTAAARRVRPEYRSAGRYPDNLEEVVA